MSTLIMVFIMSNSATQFVSVNFAEFLLENANNGNEILAVLDDIVEGADTVSYTHLTLPTILLV